jgi:FtsH-binding integral membrane protein
MAGSLVPGAVALFLPTQFAVYLISATVGLFVAGLVMLRRQTIRRRFERSHDHSLPAAATHRTPEAS